MKYILSIILLSFSTIGCDKQFVRGLVDKTLGALEQVDYAYVPDEDVCLKSKVEGNIDKGVAKFKKVEKKFCQQGEVFALKGNAGSKVFEFGEFLYSKEGAVKAHLPKSDLCLSVTLKKVDLEEVDARWEGGKELKWEKLPRIEDPECSDAVVVNLDLGVELLKQGAKDFALSVATGLLKAKLFQVVE